MQVSFGPRVYTSKGLQPDAATALRLLYGNYDADKKHSTVLTSVLPDYFVGLLGDSGPLYATAQFSSPFRENDRNKRVILTRVAPEEFECHVCAPVVGAVLFAQVNDGWEIQTASPILGRYSSSGFGQAPKATILKIGPDKMSIVLSQGYMAMGEGGTANLYLAQVDNRIEEVLEVETYGVNDEEVFNTRIQYVPGANPEYFDVKVIFIGKRKTKRSRQSVMVPFTEVKSFRFSNAKYRPA